MASIKDVLETLDPPVKHEIHHEGDTLHLTLFDPTAKARVQRRVPKRDYQDPLAFQVVLLYAVNELRSKGSHAPLQVLSPVEFP